MDETTWRVMCEGGAVRALDAVRVREVGDALGCAEGATTEEVLAAARCAAPAVDAVREIIAALGIAPDAEYRDVVAAAREECSMAEYWRAQATGMAPSVDAMAALQRLTCPTLGRAAVQTEAVVDAVRAAVQERDALRAIIAGRTTPPTPIEALAHAAAGGAWLLSEDLEDSFGRPVTERQVVTPIVATDRHAMRSPRDLPPIVEGSVILCDPSDGTYWWSDDARWWPLDASGAPCAWPTVAP